MRKLILTAAIILVSSSAFAGGSRGLSAQSAEPQKPFRQAEVTILRGPAEQPAVTTPPAPQTVEEKLKAAGELKPDGTPAAPPAQTQAPVQPAPIQAAPAQSAPAQAASAPAPVQAQPVQTPATKRVAKRGESDEHKARRIAARFGISW